MTGRVLVLAVLLVTAGCTTDTTTLSSQRIRNAPTPPPTPAATPEPPPVEPVEVKAASVGLERFSSCDDLLGLLREQARDHVGPYGIGHLDAVAQSAESREASGDQRTSAPASAPVHSTANVQETGVDEPDLVATDGRRIVAVARGHLQVVIPGEEPRLAASLPIDGAQRLLLSGDRVIALGTSRSSGSRDAATRVVVVDIRDPHRPAETARIDLEGSYVSARMVDGIVRVVVGSAAVGLPWEHPDQNRSPEQAEARNRELIDHAPIDAWLPRFTAERNGARTAGSLVECDQVHHPGDFSGFGLTTVVTLDPADPEPADDASVLADTQTVYASATSLYVATQRWPEMDTDRAEAVPVPAGTTEIHRFDIADPRRARYAASGTVPGRLLNQWSLSEHDGRLRAATTTWGHGDPDLPGASESRVAVLQQRDGALVETASVDGLGKGERIYAVRFMGPLAYVVTFREIDPLYVVDLTDPARPRVAGELKIPGYSAYLHPVGDGLLLGVGQDASEDGRTLGTQVSLFDVRDPARPTRTHHLRFDGAHSEVEHDHLAFLWWQPRGLAFLPMQIHDPEQDWTGVSVVRAAGGLDEVGRVSHPAPEGREHHGLGGIRRSLVIGDSLFTVSEAGVLATDLGTLEDRGWVSFEEP